MPGKSTRTKAKTERHLEGPGRPRAIIDLDELEKLAMLQPTLREAAAWFNVDEETIFRRLQDPVFRKRWENGQAKGRLSLRRQQIKMAEEGNATMGIWLGKQLLGQRDVTAVEMSGPGGTPIQAMTLNLSALSIAELEELRKLRAKMEPPAKEITDGREGGE